ncbi:toxin biosynthesis protein [Penicillium citrinum]|uniref:Toxin biosynthesis protein n=1 Tax=Penicillium citrinum TaxID=5077 RepID=A0A9W9P3W8_PENCI|nr:toxin biosynthesis protein [Penicillium citrinum]KAJ5234660.1 toxin biosynthesis protein [Penicillium citrinum]
MAIPKFPFTVTEHVIDGQHVREYPDATVSADAKLKLVLKQYTLFDNPNPNPGPGDITVIGTHG